MKQQIKALLENRNFRNNQNYIINWNKINKYIKFVKSYKFNKLNDSYFWELLLEEFERNKLEMIKKDFKKILILLFISIFSIFLWIPTLLYILYLISYYFWRDTNFKKFIIVKDNKKIIFSKMWYYKSKIKLGITNVYYK